MYRISRRYVAVSSTLVEMRATVQFSVETAWRKRFVGLARAQEVHWRRGSSPQVAMRTTGDARHVADRGIGVWADV